MNASISPLPFSADIGSKWTVLEVDGRTKMEGRFKTGRSRAKVNGPNESNP